MVFAANCWKCGEALFNRKHISNSSNNFHWQPGNTKSGYTKSHTKCNRNRDKTYRKFKEKKETITKKRQRKRKVNKKYSTQIWWLKETNICMEQKVFLVLVSWTQTTADFLVNAVVYVLLYVGKGFLVIYFHTKLSKFHSNKFIEFLIWFKGK